MSILVWKPDAKFWYPWHVTMKNKSSPTMVPSWFDYHSVEHLFFGILSYWSARKFLNFDSINAIVWTNISHAICDYMENAKIFSFEYLYFKLLKSRNLEQHWDHDSLNNHLGDNISFLGGTIMAALLYNKYSPSKNTILIIFILSLIIIASVAYQALGDKSKKV